MISCLKYILGNEISQDPSLSLQMLSPVLSLSILLYHLHINQLETPNQRLEVSQLKNVHNNEKICIKLCIFSFTNGKPDSNFSSTFKESIFDINTSFVLRRKRIAVLTRRTVAMHQHSAAAVSLLGFSYIPSAVRSS